MRILPGLQPLLRVKLPPEIFTFLGQESAAVAKPGGMGIRLRNAAEKESTDERRKTEEIVRFTRGNSIWWHQPGPTGPQHPLSSAPTWVQGQQVKDGHQWVHGVYLRGRDRQRTGRGKRSSDFPKTRAGSAAASSAARDRTLGSGKGECSLVRMKKNNHKQGLGAELRG